jgi:hypothetical protein
MVKEFIDNPKAIDEFLEFAKNNNCEEVTLRPVSKPEESRSQDVYDWTSNHQINSEALESICDYFEKKGKLVKKFPFGGRIYDINGMSVCLTNCLTKDAEGYMRQLIFYPNGIIATDWTKEAKLL